MEILFWATGVLQLFQSSYLYKNRNMSGISFIIIWFYEDGVSSVWFSTLFKIVVTHFCVYRYIHVYVYMNILAIMGEQISFEMIVNDL